MLEEELLAAVTRGNLNDVTSLVKQGAKVTPDTSGRTPLHLAAAGGRADIVEILLQQPKLVNITDAVGRTPLQVSAAGGHLDVIDLLIKKGANVSARDNVHGNTPLHEASWHGFSKTVALLAQNKAELDVTNCAGFAPLHLCCQNGHNQSCRELLLAGANPDIQNNYGDTALHTSARYGHAGVSRILISASCRVSDQNKNGDTALHIAAAMGRRKMTTILLESGCNGSIRNKQYETACDIATRKDLNEIIIILKSVKPHKSGKKKKKKSSETSDSDKRSKSGNEKKMDGLHQCQSGKGVPWSPYGCHYYPDNSSFPSPKLDSLPGEPLGKGEQYFLDLAGNICKGPVGVGLTCHCANFLRDMEARLEKNSAELKAQIRVTRFRLEERVERAEGLLKEVLNPKGGVRGGTSDDGYSRGRRGRRGGMEGSKKRTPRSHSLDLLRNVNEKCDSAKGSTNKEDEKKERLNEKEAEKRKLEERRGSVVDLLKDGLERLMSLGIKGEEEVWQKIPYRSRKTVYSRSQYSADSGANAKISLECTKNVSQNLQEKPVTENEQEKNGDCFGENLV